MFKWMKDCDSAVVLRVFWFIFVTQYKGKALVEIAWPSSKDYASIEKYSILPVCDYSNVEN
jgi:hypothetical protein